MDPVEEEEAATAAAIMVAMAAAIIVAMAAAIMVAMAAAIMVAMAVATMAMAVATTVATLNLILPTPIKLLEQKAGKIEVMAVLLKILNTKMVEAGEKGEILMEVMHQTKRISNPFL